MIARASALLGVNSKPLLTNAAFLMANTFVGSLFGFLFWLIAARTLSTLEVGIGAAFVSAVTVITSLGELGLGTALIRFAPRMGERQGRFINSALTLSGVVTLLVALLFALGAVAWSPALLSTLDSPAHIALFVGSAVAFGLGLLLDRVFVASETTGYVFARNLIANVLKLVVLVAVAGTLGAVGIVMAVGASAAATLLLSGWVFAPRALRGYSPRPALDWSLLRDKLGYTLGNHFAGLLWSAPTLLYPLIIIAALGAEANAHFYISWMLANLLFVAPVSVCTSAFARATNAGLLNGGPLWKATRLTLVALVVPVGVLYVGAPMLLGVFGRAYGAGGEGLFGLLLLSVFPYTVNTAALTFHRIRQNVGAILWLSGATTAACLLLSLTLGATHGLPGIGAGWLIGQTIGTAIAGVTWKLGLRTRISARSVITNNSKSRRSEVTPHSEIGRVA